MALQVVTRSRNGRQAALANVDWQQHMETIHAIKDQEDLNLLGLAQCIRIQSLFAEDEASCS